MRSGEAEIRITELLIAVMGCGDSNNGCVKRPRALEQLMTYLMLQISVLTNLGNVCGA